METFRRDDGQESIELQSTRDTEGERFPKNGTARFLRRSTDNEACYSGHSTVFGACFVAESRTFGIEWLPSDLSFIGGA